MITSVLLRKVMDRYTKGFIDGIKAFAYMKNGAYYVGTNGKTLEEAIEDVRKTWDYYSPSGGVTLTGQNNE